jgi:hypothetical protein
MIVLLLLQLTLAGGWMPHAAASSRDAAPHIEQAGAATCPAFHDDGHCLICQAMGLRLPEGDAVRLPLQAAVTERGPLPAAEPRTAGAVLQPGQPRAPPIRVA